MSDVLLGSALIAIVVAIGYLVRYGRARTPSDGPRSVGVAVDDPRGVETDASCITGDGRSVTTTVRLTYDLAASASTPGPSPSWFLEQMTVTALRDAVSGRDAVDLDTEHRAITTHTERVLQAAATERGLSVTGLRIDRFVPHASGP